MQPPWSPLAAATGAFAISVLLAGITGAAAQEIYSDYEWDSLPNSTNYTDLQPWTINVPVQFDPTWGILGDLYVGTPAQTIKCIWNSGTSDTFLMTGSCDTNSTDSPCYGWGQMLVPNISTTLAYNVTSLTPLDQLMSNRLTLNGTWAMDQVSFGNLASPVVEVTLGLVSNLGSGGGLIGLGPMNGEYTGSSMVNGVVSPTYDTILVRLKRQGFIRTMSYSFYINLESGKGTLTFGGFDSTKYTGPLYTVPLVGYFVSDTQIGSLSQPASPMENRIMLHGVTVTVPNGNTTCSADPYNNLTVLDTGIIAAVGMNDTSNATSSTDCAGELVYHFALPVLLASGYYQTFLPDKMFQGLRDLAGLTYDDQGDVFCPCDLPGTITFNFSGIAIPVPLSSFIADPVVIDNQNYTFTNGEKACRLAVFPSNGNNLAVAAPIFGYMFTVFNLDKNELGLAPSRVDGNISSQDIQGIALSIAGGTPAPLHLRTDINTTIAVYSAGHVETKAGLPLSKGARSGIDKWLVAMTIGLLFI